MIGKINQIARKTLFVGVSITSAAFLIMVLLSILSRYVLKSPILGSVELSRIFFLWSCFLAAALCYYQQSHIAITFLTDRLPEIIRKVVMLVIHGVSMVFFSVILKVSLEVVFLLWNTDLPMLGLTQAWLYLPVPVSMFFMLLFAFEFLIGLINRSSETGISDAVDTSH